MMNQALRSTIDSLTEGTTVTVATDADGNAISVTITTLSAMGGGMGGGQSAPFLFTEAVEHIQRRYLYLQ